MFTITLVSKKQYFDSSDTLTLDRDIRSPKSVIDERIVAEIASLLKTTSMPLKEVAQRMGFSSQAHLSRFFKKHKGVSPTEYKQASHFP